MVHSSSPVFQKPVHVLEVFPTQCSLVCTEDDSYILRPSVQPVRYGLKLKVFKIRDIKINIENIKSCVTDGRS